MSYDNISIKVKYDLVGYMFDTELNQMMKDLVPVLEDLEKWQEGDIVEEQYRETITEFKSKWFKRRKCDIESLVNEEFEKKKAELLKELEYMGNNKSKKTLNERMNGYKGEIPKDNPWGDRYADECSKEEINKWILEGYGMPPIREKDDVD